MDCRRSGRRSAAHMESELLVLLCLYPTVLVLSSLITPLDWVPPPRSCWGTSVLWL